MVDSSDADPLSDDDSPELIGGALSAPDLTLQLMDTEPPFRAISRDSRETAADFLSFEFKRHLEWKEVWSESVEGPGRFTDSRSIRAGLRSTELLELSHACGVEFSGSTFVVSGKVSAKLSRLTRSELEIFEETAFTRTIEYDIPSTGLVVSLHQEQEILTRELRLRPNCVLPDDPLPDWVRAALEVERISVRIPTPRTSVRARPLDS